MSDHQDAERAATKARLAKVFWDHWEALQLSGAKIPKSYVFHRDDRTYGELQRTVDYYFVDATTTKAARAFPDKKIAIFNFANRTGCGGGVTHGSKAQEEDLCRAIPELHPSMKGLSYPHPRDAVWVTPDVEIVYDDDDKNYAKLDVPCPVTVVSAAAPIFNTRMKVDYTEWCDDAADLFHTLISSVLRAAIRAGCDTIVLGAFGCGAFRGPPEKIAPIMMAEVAKYEKFFKNIVFAVPMFGDPANVNYNVFRAAYEAALKYNKSDFGAAAAEATAAAARAAARAAGAAASPRSAPRRRTTHGAAAAGAAAAPVTPRVIPPCRRHGCNQPRRDGTGPDGKYWRLCEGHTPRSASRPAPACCIPRCNKPRIFGCDDRGKVWRVCETHRPSPPAPGIAPRF